MPKYRINPGALSYSYSGVRRDSDIRPLSYRQVPDAAYAFALTVANTVIWSALEPVSDQHSLYNHYKRNLDYLLWAIDVQT